MTRAARESGFVLIVTMLMLAVLLSLLAVYSVISRIELATGKSSSDSVHGFYASEAGLNLRAEEVRATFLDYNRPTGTSPTEPNSCVGGNQGSGDFVCKAYDIGKRTVTSYIVEEPNNPVIITIPPGERYQNLNAQEYRYTTRSIATGVTQRTEAILELRFRSRLVPLFQFAAFYNKDLEILPGPSMTLSGPVHTNGDLYLDTNNTLDISGQVTTAGQLYRGRKNDATCQNKTVRIINPTTLQALLPPATCTPTRKLVTQSQITPWNGMIEFGVTELTVPEPEVLDPVAGEVYWDKADLRLVLRLDSAGNPDTTFGGTPTGVEVRESDDSVNATKTSRINSATNCPGSISTRAVGTTNALYNNREAKTIRMLDVDITALLNCIHNNNLFGTGTGPYDPSQKRLDDTTEGGIVLFLTVKGPNSAVAANSYGVRARNGTQLRSTTAGATIPKGITVVSEQAFYLQGNYNSTNKIPAAVLVDSFNVLSGNWIDANSTLALGSRTPTNTTHNVAILAGTDTTGGIEGSGGQSLGIYNGGLENYPRFHENWNGTYTYTYRGSFVSLNTPRHVNGAWVYGTPQYTAPLRNWNYDTAFNNAANLPPITPRFVYLRQELFVRDFEN